MNAQTKAQLSQHNELLGDLAQIHESAENISTTLASSAINVQQFYQQTSEHQDKMIENLKTINSTINFVIAVVMEMRTSFENQLCWLAQALGGTGLLFE